MFGIVSANILWCILLSVQLSNHHERVNQTQPHARQKRAAENIRHYWHKKRTTERITQTKVSKLMGWSHSIFGQYLNGRVAAGFTALFKMAEGLSAVHRMT